MKRSERLAKEMDVTQRKLDDVTLQLRPLMRERTSLKRRLRRLHAEYVRWLDREKRLT